MAKGGFTFQKILLGIGIMIVLVAGLLLKVETVGLSIMGGGVVILLISIIRYWGELSKYFRVILLGLLLTFLIWIGYKKFGNDNDR